MSPGLLHCSPDRQSSAPCARASNAFVSSPKCTPSRSAWLSGRGLNTTHFFDVDALFPTLHRNGYSRESRRSTATGTIHNNQKEWLCSEDNHTEPFTHIETECSPCGNYMPKSFVTKKNNDEFTQLENLEADDPRTHYSEAQYGNRSMAWIRAAAKKGPFFCFIGTTGPHLPATPAPWHIAIAAQMNISAPRTPNFNMHAPDHNHLLATHAVLDAKVVDDIDDLMRKRWGALLSIDDLFRIPIEKMLPYETDIRIPLFVRGPGIKAGTTVDQMVANVDIAPTVLDLAGIDVPAIMDGKSMAPLLTGGDATGWRTKFISEFAEGGFQTYGPFPLYDEPQNQWRMLRVINETHDFAYMEFDQQYIFDKVDFHEYYDTKKDPWQKVNLWNATAGATQEALHAELQQLYVCRGTRTEKSNCP
eukprot:gene46673-59416_t